MEILELVVLLTGLVLVSFVVDQVVPRVSAPLIQIVIGVIVAFLVSLPIDLHLDTDFFLILFIAPLLYNDACNADKLALWKNRTSIVSLAIGLVIAVMLAIGFTLNWIVPSVPLAAAFALGAALGPTDAVAVLSLSKEAKLSRQEHALLGGEALINDASGVVTFQFSIAAVTTGAFSLVDATASFAFDFFGGIVAGLILAWIVMVVQRAVRSYGIDSTTFHVLIDVMTPFAIFGVSEAIGVSGVLAVVAGGLLLGTAQDRWTGPSASKFNIVSSSVWSTFVTTLNGIVFVMLGLQLPEAAGAIFADSQISPAELMGLVVVVAVIAVGVRLIWITALAYFGANKQKRSVRALFRGEVLKTSLVTTFGGAKGAVTLVIVMSIPYTLANGSSFPERDLLVFLASGVIVLTLLLANFLLPILAPNDDSNSEFEEHAPERVEVLRNVIARLAALQTPENRRVIARVINGYNGRIARIQSTRDRVDSTADLEVRRVVLDAQVKELERAVDADKVDAAAGYEMLTRLTRMQVMLRERRARREGAFRLIRRFRTFLHVIWATVVHMMPGVHQSEQQVCEREVRIVVEHAAVHALAALVDDPAYPNEVVTEQLVRHQRTLRQLRSAAISVTSAAITSESMEDYERMGLRFELEEIQDMLDAERIPRSVARIMRENVNLMLTDLGDAV